MVSGRRFATSTSLAQVPFVTEPRDHVYFKTIQCHLSPCSPSLWLVLLSLLLDTHSR